MSRDKTLIAFIPVDGAKMTFKQSVDGPSPAQAALAAKTETKSKHVHRSSFCQPKMLRAQAKPERKERIERWRCIDCDASWPSSFGF
jgi:hypothetical protein